MGYNYSKFINVGVERQQNSVTVDEATRNYARSCECCISQGRNFNYDCDCDCPITIAHRDKLDTILTLRQIEHQKKMKKDEELRKKLSECITMIENIYQMIYCPNQLDEHNEELDGLVNKWVHLKGGDK